MSRYAIVGNGYVGQRLLRHLHRNGHSVVVLARSAASAEIAQQVGAEVVRGDLDGGLPAGWAAGRTLFYLAPPPPSGDRDLRLRRWLGSLGDAVPRRVVYISTTGVYGDCAGALVDETRAPNPTSERARRRADAETQLRLAAESRGFQAVVLRVPGIYGPGRLPRRRLESGLPILEPAESGWSNRIHVDDLVSILFAAARAESPEALYNVSDGESGTMSGYFLAVADALGLPRPPVISRAEAQTALTAEMLSYLNESRRIDNRRMLRLLEGGLRYPDLASGLAASLAEEQAAGR